MNILDKLEEVYLVYIAKGCYDDHWDHLVGLFSSLEEAQQSQQKLQAMIDKIKTLPHPIDPSILHELAGGQSTFDIEDKFTENEYNEHIKWSNFLWPAYEVNSVFVEGPVKLNELNLARICEIFFKYSDYKINDFLEDF